jgi:hypothetical protein
MPKITYEQEEEYRRLKTQRDVLDCAISQMVGYDAAIRVIVRHDLLQEFAEEVRAAGTASSNKNGTP